MHDSIVDLFIAFLHGSAVQQIGDSRTHLVNGHAHCLRSNLGFGRIRPAHELAVVNHRGARIIQDFVQLFGNIRLLYMHLGAEFAVHHKFDQKTGVLSRCSGGNDRKNRKAFCREAQGIAFHFRFDDFRLLPAEMDNLRVVFCALDILQADLNIHRCRRLDLIALSVHQGDVKKSDITDLLRIGIFLPDGLKRLVAVGIILPCAFQDLFHLNAGIRGKKGRIIVGNGNDIVAALCRKGSSGTPVNVRFCFRRLFGSFCFRRLFGRFRFRGLFGRFLCRRLLCLLFRGCLFFRILCRGSCLFGGRLFCRSCGFFFRDLRGLLFFRLFSGQNSRCFRRRLCLFVSSCLCRKRRSGQHGEYHNRRQSSRKESLSQFHSFSFTFLSATMLSDFCTALPSEHSF